MSFKVLNPGFQTSIQDLGREHYMHLGIGRSGAMDPISLKLANTLVAAPLNQAAVEFTMIGPDLSFDKQTQIAITGAEVDYRINNQSVPTNQTLTIKAGDRLQFKGMKNGLRGYIGFRDRLKLESVLGSHSTQLNVAIGSFDGRAFKVGDQIELEESASVSPVRIKPSHLMRYSGHYQLRLTESPETGLFGPSVLEVFYKQKFQVAQAIDRMGIRLISATQQLSHDIELTSRGLLAGAVQLPPDGNPIIAGVDAQTIGGYPRIGQIARIDQAIIGQLKPGDSLTFQPISLESARARLKTQQQLLAAPCEAL